jgi:hypothetical protein
MLARRNVSPLYGTFLTIAALTLEKQFHALSATQPTGRTYISSHLKPSAASEGGNHCAEWALHL